METTATIEFGKLFMTLFGGLAIFLFGMEQLDNALKRVAGARMKKLLASLTTNRFMGVFTGALTTSILQSSSVTTVLVVGFVSAGLMTLTQSIGVIMGANIGTTITAQIVAFKVTKYALWMAAGGFALYFISKDEKRKQYGLAILGLGLIFYGLTLMGTATKPLRAYAPFIALMESMANPFLGILVGWLFTSIIQSSSATTGIVIVLASEGLITLEAGIALAMGANLGTCVTALLAAIGRPREAVQAAVVHLFFNVGGVLLWFFFIPQLASVVTWLSPSYPELAGVERMAAETPRQIANAHTMFNVINTFVFIWFVGPLAKMVQWLVPDRKKVVVDASQTKYLEDILLDTPALALDQIRLELGRLGNFVRRMITVSFASLNDGTQESLDNLVKMDDDVDALHAQIVTYLSQLSQEEMLTEQSVQLSNFMSVANYLENIGNRVKTNIVEAGRERLKHNAKMSQETCDLLKELDAKVVACVEEALEALIKKDIGMARDVISERTHINRLIEEAEEHLEKRMTAPDPNRAVLFHIEFEAIEYHERVFYFAERIANVATRLNGSSSSLTLEEPETDALSPA